MKNRKSFNSVRFEKESGKNYVVKSVLSKDGTDFFIGGEQHDDFTD